MATRFPSIRVEGGFFAADLIDSIAEGRNDVTGQAPKDFQASNRSALLDQIAAAFGDARSFYQSFERRAAQLGSGESGVGFTRTNWIIPLLNLLGYELTFTDKAAEADGLTFAISHWAGAAYEGTPVHIIGAGQKLDTRAESGRPRLAPHSLLQDFLNRKEGYLYGLVTNGKELRLLRDSQRLRRQAYIEFDLATLFSGEGRFADFALFYRLLHRSRFPEPGGNPDSCLLEQYYTQTIEQGGRVREKLRQGVERAIPLFANALLDHSGNTALREEIEAGRLTARKIHEQLLRVIYRLLFLMVTEERNLLGGTDLYRESYSIARLRRLVEVRAAWNSQTDLWTALQSTFLLFSKEEFGSVLEVPPLNGDLFDHSRTRDLNSARITNREFLNALGCVVLYQERPQDPKRRINYSALDVEELGSVYEALLDLQPVIDQSEGRTRFRLLGGTERKTTGSYYTRTELVDQLIESALEPVIEDRLKGARTKEDRRKRLLSIAVCDPASGSGHFLLAAARCLARELARVDADGDEPSPKQFRLAIREVIGHCIYGVDLNPLAVELCKVALWIESHADGKPLSFLDHRILNGNSLVGLRNLAVLKRGIPDDAYKPVSGDDKDAAKAIRKRNQLKVASLFAFEPDKETTHLKEARRELNELEDDTPDLVRRKKAAFDQVRQSAQYQADCQAASAFCAAFFSYLTAETIDAVPTTGAVNEAIARRQIFGPTVGLIAELDYRVRFFHWPLEFPEVFSRGGFDVMLSNPPWERIKLQEEEFFSTRDVSISSAPNAAARKRLIKELPEQNPDLAKQYATALHDAESFSRFLRYSGFYPLTARGDINTYSIFAERLTSLVTPKGRVGAVLPTGIATDDTNKLFFAHVATNSCIASLFDFENREGLFAGVHRSYKFCLLTLLGAAPESPLPARFAFFLTRAAHLRDPQRVFALESGDFELLNPNTRTCPIFRTRADAELTRKIYRKVPILLNEKTGRNVWGISFQRMFDMSNDSGLFQTGEFLEREGFELSGNRFVNGKQYLPLYEAKMIHQFDHRWATYEGTEIRDVTQEEKQQPDFVAMSRYWVPAREVYLRSAFLPEGLRDAIRDGEADLVRLGLAHLFFAKWLLVKGVARLGLFEEWCGFVEQFSFARSLAPTQMGLNGSNPPQLTSASRDDLPAEPIDKITRGPRSATAWYAVEPEILEQYVRSMEQFRVHLPMPSVGNGVDVWEIAEDVLREAVPKWLLGFRRNARANDERTGIFTVFPTSAVGDSIFLISSRFSPLYVCLLLANANSLVLDQMIRQKVSGINMSYYFVEQFPILPPETYSSADIRFIIPRILELCCTTPDMVPFLVEVTDLADPELKILIEEQARSNREMDGRHFHWIPSRRATIRSELDAYYSMLYGIDEKELRFILDPSKVFGEDFPGETFRVLKDNDLKDFGEYRTERLVLEAWDALRGMR